MAQYRKHHSLPVCASVANSSRNLLIIQPRCLDSNTRQSKENFHQKKKLQLCTNLSKLVFLDSSIFGALNRWAQVQMCSNRQSLTLRATLDWLDEERGCSEAGTWAWSLDDVPDEAKGAWPPSQLPLMTQFLEKEIDAFYSISNHDLQAPYK